MLRAENPQADREAEPGRKAATNCLQIAECSDILGLTVSLYGITTRGQQKRSYSKPVHQINIFQLDFGLQNLQDLQDLIDLLFQFLY